MDRNVAVDSAAHGGADFDLTVSRVTLALTKKCPPRWQRKVDSRSRSGLVCVLTGSADFVFSACLAEAREGDVVYLEKGASYTIRSTGDVPLSFVVISFNMTSEGGLPVETVTKGGNAKRFLEMFGHVEEKHVAKGIAYQLCCRSMVEQILYHLITERFSAGGKLGKLQESVNFIENNYNRKLSVENLAGLAYLSVSHYRKLFKEVYRLSPVEYIHRLRIEKAKEMLKTGLYSQTEIASLCGFENAQYFSRVFKKATGFAPGKY